MDLKNERFLVTGAAGFVGANLTRRLVKRGYHVHALVSPGSDLWRIQDILGSLTLYRADLTDVDAIGDLVAKTTPDIIFHLATHGAYSFQNEAKRILMTNVLGTCNLLEALDQVPYKLFINAGSSSEYGFKQKPMNENDLPQPNSYYSVAKLAQTNLCQYTAQSRKKPIVTLRLFSVYGPYEDPNRLVVTIIRRCLNKEALDMVAPDTARDFIFVDDVVDAFLNIEPLLGQGGQIFNAGTGRQTTIKEITDLVLKLTGASVEVRWNAMKDRLWDSSFWVADIEKSKKVLAWSPKTSLEQGLMKTIEEFKNR